MVRRLLDRGIAILYVSYRMREVFDRSERITVVKDGALAIATVMTCTLSVDHRIVDGALAAEWIAEFKRIVEQPLSLML